MEIDQALEILRAFEDEGVHYVLIGAMAMGAQGLVRATRDIDLIISADDDNVARIKRALKSLFDDPSIDDIRAEDLAGGYPVVQYAPPEGSFTIDFVARLGDMFSMSNVESEIVTVGGVRVHVATPGMLYKMKRDTVRPQDKLDAAVIKETFDLQDDD